MKKLSFKIRIVTGFSIIVFLSLIIVAVGIFQIKSISSSTELMYQHPFTVNSSVKDISIHINAIHRSMKDVALSEK